MKNNSKSEGLRLDGLNIYDYKFREYLCYFDLNASVPDRLRYLALGLQLFRSNGFSQAQYLEFQNHRQLITKLVMGGMIVLLMVIDIVLLCKLLIQPGNDFWYNVYVHALAAAIAIVIFYAVRVWSKTIRANFTHINTAMSSQKCLKLMQLGSLADRELFLAIADGVEEGDIDGVYITDQSVPSLSIVTEKVEGTVTVSSRPGALLVGESDTLAQNLAGKAQDSDVKVFGEQMAFEQFERSENGGSELLTFRNQLIELSRQQNRFNGLPMAMVIDFFNVMCCPECKYEVPQMTENDFIRFINAAFLGQELEGKIRLFNSHNRKMFTREIFHQFMNVSLSYLKLPPSGASEKYRRLLSDHFEGYEEKNTADNFRTEINNRLEDIRNRYKGELRFLQWLQTAMRQ